MNSSTLARSAKVKPRSLNLFMTHLNYLVPIQTKQTKLISFNNYGDLTICRTYAQVNTLILAILFLACVVFVDPSGTIFTDDARAYRGLNNHHAVKHSIGKYVRNNIHTNGIESFWVMFKRGLYGTYHKMSFKHLEMYISEFVRRNNIRQPDSIAQMQLIFQGMKGRRLTYANYLQ